MEKPTLSAAAVSAEEITEIKERGETYNGKAVVARVVHHVAGQERVEALRLDDGSEVIIKGGAEVAKWPAIKYPLAEAEVQNGE
jgi:hypothetical protein